jgi:small subunit ribosomal protein S17
MLEARGGRRQLTGVVTSEKASKGRVVTVKREKRHPLYQKVIRRTTTLHVHDEENASRLGDTVEVAETRPLSKLKRWRLIRVLKKGLAATVRETQPDTSSGVKG